MANNTLIASDNFASGALAVGWGTFAGYSKTKVVGSGASAVTEPNTLSTNAGEIWNSISWGNDQIVEVTLGAGFVAEASSFVNVGVRLQSGSTLSGYLFEISGTSSAQLQLYSFNSGTGTLVHDVSCTPAAGDVWTFAVFGSCLTAYQNGKRIFYVSDITWSSGYPGIVLYSSTDLVHAQVAAFRAYSPLQQDGVWQKQGIVIPANSTDLSGNDFNGTANMSQIFQGSAVLLSGTVYFCWFSSNSQNIYYAESVDGKTWTRSASAVISGQEFPGVIEVSGTFYIYCQPDTNDKINLYTTTDRSTYSAYGSNPVIDPGAEIFGFIPVAIISGTWYAFYTKAGTNFVGQMHLLTSSNGKSWTEYGSNPVITNFWNSSAFALVNGVWYMWGASNQPGQGNVDVPDLDPTDTIRAHTTNFIDWTVDTPSIHHIQQNESLNANTGQAFANTIINIGGKAYMYYTASPSDGIEPSIYQIALATAPVPIASLVTQIETATNQIKSDPFTSGAGNLDGNWTTPTGGTALEIVTGPYVEPTITSTVCSAVYTGASFGTSQYSEITIEALTGTLGQSIVAPTVLASTAAQTWYEAQILSPIGTSDAAAKIAVRVNGTPTQIGPTATITPSVGDVFQLAVTPGSDGFPVLTLYQNGYVILQVQDYSATLSSGNPGMWASSTVAIGDAQISFWAGGDANVIPNYPSAPSAGGFLPPFGAGPTGTLGEGASLSASSNRTSAFGPGRTEVIG